jgi:hypothetical protein
MENKFKIIDVSDYILAVSDEEPKMLEWFYDTLDHVSSVPIYQRNNKQKSYKGCVKITAHKPKNNAPELDLPLLPDVVIENNVQNFIEPLLKKKAKENNTIDLDAYALGLIDSSKLVYKFTIGDNGKIYLTGTYLYE